VGFGVWEEKAPQAEKAAEKVVILVIPSEARNFSEGSADEKKERFLASLGMTKSRAGLFPQSVCHAGRADS
jgi:hypothetical protein